MVSIVIYKIIIIKNYFYYYFFYEGNEEESLHEGDIRLSFKQEIALEMFGDPTAPVLGARGITKYQNLLWNTRVVPYDISSELGELNNERKKSFWECSQLVLTHAHKKNLFQCYVLRKHYYYYILLYY